MKKAVIISLIVAIPLSALLIYFVANSLNDSKDATTSNNSQQEMSSARDTPVTVDATALEYYYEIGLGSEFGGGSAAAKKWMKPSISVSVDGTYNQNGVTCVDQTIADFNDISKETKLQRAESSSDITIQFAPEPTFSSLLKEYVPRNMGYFWTRADASGALNNATILIDTASINDTERCHLIREELTQSLGLMNDSDKHADSMFYIDWTYTTQYSELDKQIISILYGGNGIEPGMGRAEIEKLFERDF